MRTLFGIVQAVLCASAGAQVTWTPLLVPASSSMCYDSVRDRLVVPAWPLTYEFDGTVWTAISSAGGGQTMAFDRNRARVVTYGPGVTLEWDGVSWATVSASPPTASVTEDLMTFHAGRGRVVALSATYVPSFPWRRLELYDWDGATWTHIPSVSPLVITNTAPGNSDFSYNFCVYDAARDKLVVHGVSYWAGTHLMQFSSTWEWDAVNDWVSYGPSGPYDSSYVWFDEHRGVVLRATETQPTSTVLQWDPAQGWVTMGTLNNLPAYYNGGAYDSKRNRYYYGTSATSMAVITDLHSAQYSLHGAACVASSPPTLSLSRPWTRAWLGSSLDVTAANLPQSSAVLAMGFSDQQYGGTPLPLNLTSHGMPGCMLHVAPDATMLLVGGNNAASQQIPIPYDLALLGVTFWQQALAVAPGTNPTGMLTTASMRGTVGRAY